MDRELDLPPGQPHAVGTPRELAEHTSPEGSNGAIGLIDRSRSKRHIAVATAGRAASADGGDDEVGRLTRGTSSATAWIRRSPRCAPGRRTALAAPGRQLADAEADDNEEDPSVIASSRSAILNEW